MSVVTISTRAVAKPGGEGDVDLPGSHLAPFPPHPQCDAHASLRTRPFLPLQETLEGRYFLKRELGRGGMGIVYLAHEVVLDRLVALKVLPLAQAAEPARRERFLREARTAARLSHGRVPLRVARPFPFRFGLVLGEIR